MIELISIILLFYDLAPLLSLIGAANHEIVYTCLQHVEVILYRSSHLFREHYHSFFCR